MKALLKNTKLLLVFITSLYIYLYMEFSVRVNNTIIMLAESSSSKALGVYIAIHIAKCAAFLFSLISLIFLIKLIVVKKEN